jgi:hypothetical protein
VVRVLGWTDFEVHVVGTILHGHVEVADVLNGTLLPLVSCILSPYLFIVVPR